MHFHVVLFGKQHEIWPKQYNGKVRKDDFLLGWRECVPLRLNNLLENGLFRRLLHSPLHIFNGILPIRYIFS